MSFIGGLYDVPSCIHDCLVRSKGPHTKIFPFSRDLTSFHILISPPGTTGKIEGELLIAEEGASQQKIEAAHLRGMQVIRDRCCVIKE